MDAPLMPGVVPSCGICSAAIAPPSQDPQARLVYHKSRQLQFCGKCYISGKFSARCVVCGKEERCAPVDHGDPWYTCMPCQWTEQGARVHARLKAARIGS